MLFLTVAIKSGKASGPRTILKYSMAIVMVFPPAKSLLLPWAATTSNALAFDIRYGFTWMNLVEYKFMEYSTKVEYQGVSVNISQNSWSFVSYLFVTQ